MSETETPDVPDYPDHSPFIENLLGLLRRPSPVFALPRRELYEVTIRGDGFRLSRPDSPSPYTAFLTTRVVAASTLPSATTAALALVAKDPRLEEISQVTRSGISLSVTQVATLYDRFLWFSTSPFLLYSPEDAAAAPDAP